jgi:hypothetical protein
MNPTPKQLDTLYDQLAPKLGYLMRLERRLIAIGAMDDDELLRHVRQAQDGMHQLCVAVHYMACQSGVWRQPVDGDTLATREHETMPD